MTAGEAADLLAPDRKNWGPLGSTRSWRALVKAGHQPFDLLFRDLDLVAKAASAIGGQLLVLNYPSPSEDHVALREVLAEYTATRDVEVLDLWGLFDSQFSDAQWSELMAPNGHCNAAGYQVMGEAIADHVQKRGLLHP